MDDPVEFERLQALVERLPIGEIDLEKVERAGRGALQFGQPVALERRIVISVEIVDADDTLAALQQPPRDMIADETRGAGDERGQGTHRDTPWGSSRSRQMP
jgi:hypothetical protein